MLTVSDSRVVSPHDQFTMALVVSCVLGMAYGQLPRTQDLLSPAMSPAALLGALSGPGPAANHSQSVGDGNLERALSTMDFHRSMMNEYLCHNYLASEILSGLSPMESRTGEPATPPMGPEGGQDHLLADLGSSSYKEWLEKSAQLEDMYAKLGKKTIEEQHGYETGDVTGYATVPASKDSGYTFPQPAEFTHPVAGGSWKGGGSGFGAWSGDSGWYDNGGYEASGWDEHESFKGLALKELFDLGLTALAFLAFGIFVLNLIMTCFAKTPNVNLVMTNTTSSTAFGRTGRAMDNTQLNDLAQRVLSSVDTFMESREHSSRDNCLEFVLCSNNKYSRVLNDNYRIWLPVWSLGMSWVAGQQMLENLHASVLGLGDADCGSLYPQCTHRGLDKTSVKPT